MEATLDDGKIKDLFKQAIIEEKRDVVHDIMMDGLEEVAIVRAIEEGDGSGRVGRNDIFSILEGNEGSAWERNLKRALPRIYGTETQIKNLDYVKEVIEGIGR